MHSDPMKITRKNLALGAIAWAAMSQIGCASPARAGVGHWRKVVLVELFTSQGCSSCPAADAFVAELPRLGFQRDRVVPLTFHVDYWDDLGWPDPFASSRFTARQRRYAGLGRLASPNGSRAPSGVYTPQMIVDGMVHFSGSQRDIALREISRAGAVAPTFSIAAHTTTVRDQAQIVVQVQSGKGATASGDWRVWAALAAKSARTVVPRGENSGETLMEAAVVRAMSQEVPLTGQTISLSLSKPAPLAWNNAEVVVVVQSFTTGDIAAAVAMDIAL